MRRTIAIMTRRATRRWLARVALCVALGLVTTVTVAWALAAWLPHRNLWGKGSFVTLRAGGDVRGLETWECGRIGMLRRTWRVTTGGSGVLYLPLDEFEQTRAAPRSRVTRDGPLWAAGAMTRGIEDARGWPALALWCEFDRSPSDDRVWRAGGGHVISGFGRKALVEVRVLPMRPLWRGLVTNTGVYALTWGVLLAAPAWVRRARRRSKGCCTGCGYDREGLAQGVACPECGALMSPHHHQSKTTVGRQEPRA